MKALVIDDDEDDLIIFCSAIAEADKDMLCLTAEGGDEAIAIINQDPIPPDFIFIDIQMPKMTGQFCLKLLKTLPKLKEATIIMISSSENETEINECKRLGATFLLKQGSYKKLVSVLKQLFQAPK